MKQMLYCAKLNSDLFFNIFTVKTVEAESEVTLRHLLTHTSGLGYGVDFGQDADPTQVRYESLVNGVHEGRISSLAQFVDELAAVPLLFEPGTKKEYSYAADVMGRVVEVASGQRLDRFLKELTFS